MVSTMYNICYKCPVLHDYTHWVGGLIIFVPSFLKKNKFKLVGSLSFYHVLV